MTLKRCIKCGKVNDYIDIDERCRHCKGALVKEKIKAKGPSEAAKIVWEACDECFNTRGHTCQRSVDAGIHKVVGTHCDIWKELTE